MKDGPRSAQGEKSGGGGAVVAVAALVIIGLPFLYVLSLGPVLWLFEGGQNDHFLEIVYAPLVWLYDNVESTRPAFEWYLELWGVH
jgi:hypothetical protein